MTIIDSITHTAADRSNQLGLELPHSVYGGLGADVDGDTLSVHIPISYQAQQEAKFLLAPSANQLSRADGHVMHTPAHECLAGLYHATEIQGEVTICSRSYEELARLYGLGRLTVNQAIRWRGAHPTDRTCLGRLALEELSGIPVQATMDKKSTSSYYGQIIGTHDPLEVGSIFDAYQAFGYEIITRYGPSICLDSFQDPVFDLELQTALDLVEQQAKELTVDEGLALWQSEINRLYQRWLDADAKGSDGQLRFYAKAASRVSPVQVRQLVIAKGIQARVDGSLIPTAVRGNYTKGLTVGEYVLSVHGARASHIAKLKITPDSGYLTRRLVTAARDIYVTEVDCGTQELVQLPDAYGHLDAYGCVITDHGPQEARSVLACRTVGGICQQCYGITPDMGMLPEIGRAAGVIAGQSSSEGIIQACFSADTEILDVNFLRIRFDDAHSRVQGGEALYTFSCSSGGKVEVSRIVDSFKHRRESTSVRVTLDNGETFRSTLDHKIMLRNGEYTPAGELMAGTSLMPLRATARKDGGNRRREVATVEVLTHDEEYFYDLEVDSVHHNFPLAAGNFVSNSMKLKHESGAGKARTDGVTMRAPVDGTLLLNYTDHLCTAIIGPFTYTFLVDRTDVHAAEGVISAGTRVLTAYPELQSTVQRIDHILECRSSGTRIVAEQAGSISYNTNAAALRVAVDGEVAGTLTKAPLQRWAGESVEAGTLLVDGMFNITPMYAQDPESALIYAVQALYDILEETGVPALQHLEVAVRSLLSGGELLGLTKASVNTPATLRALSFGHARRVLARDLLAPPSEIVSAAENLMRGQFPTTNIVEEE